MAGVTNAETIFDTGVQVAELCRAHLNRETSLSTLFRENGFEEIANEKLERVARLEASHARLRRAERHPTFRPDPSEFEDEQIRMLERLKATIASEREDIFIPTDALDLFVSVSHAPKRRCGFTYHGHFVDWPDLLGYTRQNAKQISNPFVYQTPPLVEASNRRGVLPGLGVLSIISQTFEPADFGDDHPVTTWVLAE